MVSKSRVAFVLGFSFLSQVTFGAPAAVSWVSSRTNKTWNAYPHPAAMSLLDAKTECQDLGLTLPNTGPKEMEEDFFEFLGTALGPDAADFPRFNFRSVEVRFFPLTNQFRKEARFLSSQKRDGELVSYYSSLLSFCEELGNSNCAATSRRQLDLIGNKMKLQEKKYRQIGFHLVFVDTLGNDANLEVLEQEYKNFYVQKASYETARTLLALHEENRSWSGLICVSK